MIKKKFVIISPVIFPAQYPRAFRATELAKELGRQGYCVTLYGTLGKYDYSQFESDNPNIKIKNIGPLMFAKINSDGIESIPIWNRALTRLLGKLTDFPNIEFMFKIPKILKNEEDTDCLITIGMPHAIHWGAALYKKKSNRRFPKTWIADCGDPYMGNSFTKRPFYFKYIEKWFCRKVDFLTVPFEGARGGYYQEFQHKIFVIPQGFNFNEIKLNPQEPSNDVITFVYAGVFYKEKRDPTLFLQYLSTLSIDFKFLVFTKSKELLQPFLPILKGKLQVHNYIARKDLLQIMSRADFLVNIENKSAIQSPSKLIDYGLTGRPILNIESFVLDKNMINNFFSRNYQDQYRLDNLEQYDIKNVANKFVKLASSNK